MNRFLFGPYPLQLQSVDKIFFFISVAILAIGVLLVLVLFFTKLNPVNKKLVKRIRNFSFSLGLLGLIWSGFRYENATYLLWRFWFVVIAAAHLPWLARIVWFLIRDYSSELKEFKHQQVKEKYLR